MQESRPQMGTPQETESYVRFAENRGNVLNSLAGTAAANFCLGQKAAHYLLISADFERLN
jgi:hypothetical protein